MKVAASLPESTTIPPLPSSWKKANFLGQSNLTQMSKITQKSGRCFQTSGKLSVEVQYDGICCYKASSEIV